MTRNRTMVEIADRFEEAVDTLRRLPPVKVPGYFSTWPEIIRPQNELLQMEKARLRLGPPSSFAISEMEETIQWIFFLDDEDERRIIWMRAAKVPWKLICRWRGCGRTTAYHQWQVALLKIVTALIVKRRHAQIVRTQKR